MKVNITKEMDNTTVHYTTARWSYKKVVLFGTMTQNDKWWYVYHTYFFTTKKKKLTVEDKEQILKEIFR